MSDICVYAKYLQLHLINTQNLSKHHIAITFFIFHLKTMNYEWEGKCPEIQ
jgi:hypothetical protein